MFKNEKIVVVDNKDRTLKLVDNDGRILSLIFIKKDKIIIRGELDTLDSTIESPEIKII